MPQTALNFNCPVIPILLAGMIHFTLASLALVVIGSPAYFFVHLFLILVALWCARDTVSLVPVLTFIYILVFSGVVDIILLAVYWEGIFQGTSLSRFAAAMVIINLLLKPTTFLFSLFVVYTRNGGLDFSKFLTGFTSATNEYGEVGGSVDVESNSGRN